MKWKQSSEARMRLSSAVPVTRTRQRKGPGAPCRALERAHVQRHRQGRTAPGLLHTLEDGARHPRGASSAGGFSLQNPVWTWGAPQLCRWKSQAPSAVSGLPRRDCLPNCERLGQDRQTRRAPQAGQRPPPRCSEQAAGVHTPHARRAASPCPRPL